MQEIAFFVLGALAMGLILVLLNVLVSHRPPAEEVDEVEPPSLVELLVADSTAKAIKLTSTEETREFVRRIYDEIEEERQTQPALPAVRYCPPCRDIAEEHDLRMSRHGRPGEPWYCAHHQRAASLLDLEFDCNGWLEDDDNFRHEGAA